MTLEPVAIAAIVGAFLAAGVAKGATGAGAPVIAVPVVAAFTDVRLAVVMMVVPNLITNALQMVRFRAHRPDGAFVPLFAIGGGVGAVVGTWLLVSLPERTLSLLLAGAVLAYVTLRLTRADFRLSESAGRQLVVPCGLGGGLLHGAAGISAPFSLSFLNAMRLPRAVFIATVSSYFLAITVVQAAALVVAGLMTLQATALSVAACAPLLAAMPAGGWLATKLPEAAFDKVILGLLMILAVRLVWSALS